MQDVTLLRMDGPRCSNSLCCRILLPLFSVSPLICCEILVAKRGALRLLPGAWRMGALLQVCLPDGLRRESGTCTLSCCRGGSLGLNIVLRAGTTWSQ